MSKASSDNTRRAQVGFTILELMVSVTIMGMLAVIAMPSATASNERKLDMIELQMQDAIDHAQSLSYHTGVKYGVRFDVNDQWIAVINEQGVPVQDPLTRSYYVVRFTPQPGQPVGATIDYAAFGFDRPTIAFDTKGNLEYPGTVVISAGDLVRTLGVNSATAQLFEQPIQL